MFSESILAATRLTARGVFSLYNGNKTGGVLGKWPYLPYYWFESGGAWGGLLEYWHYTGDSQFNDALLQGIIAQLGPNNDFVVPAESFDTGNDDQGFWLFVAMAAAEYSFPQLPAPHLSWFQIAQNGWEDYVSRWNNTGCAGGLKWHFNPANAGFYYKNSVSNGAFFQLSARLARFTGNQTYVTWADTVWNWVTAIGLIDDIYNVYDGTDELINCTGIDHHQWSYNVGTFLYGSAMLQNFTNGSQPWVDRTAGLLDAVNTFVSPYRNSTDVLFEAACELVNVCNVDQYSMKAYTIRWLAATSKMAPFTAGRIGDILRASAQGAAASCNGGHDGTTCGSKWYTRAWDGTSGLGQELSALEAMYALLVNQTNPPAIYPNVNIDPALPSPTNDVSATSMLPPVSDAARPLHDGAPLPSSSASTTLRTVVAAAVSIFAVM
jgi:mannan endo-1,6-alpha-mannosidase